MNPKPIKRSKSLVPLSKDHHEGLLIVWKIRQGQKNHVTEKRIADFVSHAFTKHLQPHFLEEEELLFSKLPAGDELLLKAKEQHASIRKMIAELRPDQASTSTELTAIGDLLEEHIRFEERKLFPYLEKQLTPEDLQEIGSQLESLHQKQEPLFWEDEFWLRK